MKKHEYVAYILLCNDGTYYNGVTNNLKRRFMEHQMGTNEESYTSSRLPVELVYYEKFKYIDKAIKREKQIKRWSHEKKKALIENNLHRLKSLAKKKFN